MWVEDYCLGSAEAHGRWVGSGSARLGLSGVVEVTSSGPKDHALVCPRRRQPRPDPGCPRSGVSHPISPHGRRRTLCTTWLVAGISIRDMQDATRHADPPHHQALRHGRGQPRPARGARRSGVPRRHEYRLITNLASARTQPGLPVEVGRPGTTHARRVRVRRGLLRPRCAEAGQREDREAGSGLDGPPGMWKIPVVTAEPGALRQHDALLEQVRNLERALVSRAEIGTAVGIIVATFQVSRDAAWDVLVRCSQQQNVKVRDLSGSVIAAAESGDAARLHALLHSQGQDLGQEQEAPASDMASGLVVVLGERLRVEPLERRLADLVNAADARDWAAEKRDGAAEDRDAAATLRAERGRRDDGLDRQDREQAGIDRLLAAADRDAAAIDRADLLDALKEARVERDDTRATGARPGDRAARRSDGG